jgi:hypothetical protein
MSSEPTVRAGSAPDRTPTNPPPAVAGAGRAVARPLIVVQVDPTADAVDTERLDAVMADLLLDLVEKDRARTLPLRPAKEQEDEDDEANEEGDAAGVKAD